MKIFLLITFLTGYFFIGCSNGQTNPNLPTNASQYDDNDKFAYSFKTAHPKAQALMKEDFFWSPIEENAPFGNDDGFDAAYGFRDWRIQHKATSPVKYLDGLIKEWNYPFFDYSEMDAARIHEYILSGKNPDESEIQQQIKGLKEAMKNSPDTTMKGLNDNQLRELILTSSKSMGVIYLLGQDNAIIGTAFAQLVLEGRVEEDIKKLAIIAINRQLLPILINRFDENYRGKRKDHLTKMLEVIKLAN